MAAATSVQDGLPAGVTLAIERIDAADLEARAASANIQAYADTLVEARRREYLAGRLAARAALQALGADDPTVGRHGEAPAWPRGSCGSISHSSGLAVAVAGHAHQWRALGVDIEARFAARRIRILQQAMSAAEFAAAAASTDPWVWTRAWAAKESAYKCLSALGVDAAFDTLMPHWLDPARGHLLAQVGDGAIRIELRCRIHDELVWVVAGVGSTDSA